MSMVTWVSITPFRLTRVKLSQNGKCMWSVHFMMYYADILTRRAFAISRAAHDRGQGVGDGGAYHHTKARQEEVCSFCFFPIQLTSPRYNYLSPSKDLEICSNGRSINKKSGTYSRDQPRSRSRTHPTAYPTLSRRVPWETARRRQLA